MRDPARSFWLLVAAASLWGAPATALVMFDWRTVGDAGNACDDEPDFGCYGDVDYIYRIATYEVTNAQYVEFLTAKAADDPLGLYNPGMATAPGGIMRSGNPGDYIYSAVPGREDMPVSYVSFFDTLRFANWLHNGQGDGDTETGAYTLLGGTPTPSNLLVQRNAEATIWVATDEEWYKAAHYDTASGSYSEYQTGTDVPVVCTAPTATPNTANCDGFDGSGPGDFTDAGSYPGSPSANGTFDQCGNALEWVDGLVGVLEQRIMRGGGYWHPPERLGREIRDYDDPWVESARVGFRVATRAGECADGIDNDGDGGIDFDPVTFASPGDETTPPAGLGDPSCMDPGFPRESSRCQDGIDNDGDGTLDYDAGLSVNGVADPNGPDPQCVSPWRNREVAGCGLGFELVALSPLLVWRSRRAKTVRRVNSDPP
jgi:formylglycine-generating enzyme required for sulfatase activity